MKVVGQSRNRKLGPTGATYRRVGPTCPKTCALLDNGCYAQKGFVGMIQLKSGPVDSYKAELEKAKSSLYVRHLVSGDLLKPTKDDRRVVDRDLCRAIWQFHEENPRVVGWGYTHKPAAVANAGFGPETMPSNLLILASCDTRAEADEHAANGWKTALVQEERLGLPPESLYCPVDLAKHNGKDTNVTCVSCQRCWVGTDNIVFLKF